MANTQLILSSLSFSGIRQNLRDFIASKAEFSDYDFNDSALGTLLDLMAYNTYYNSYYVNQASIESFLDSAQIYDNVVSRAKLIGYTPTSERGATANVRIQFTTAVATPEKPTLTISKNTKFTSSINGVSYIFVTPKSYTIAANSINRFEADIDLVEGIPLTHRFVYTTANTQFVLPNSKVDTRSISVEVNSSGDTAVYTPVDDILTVNSSSQIFYLDADREDKYKISFGDDVLGKRPPLNSLVSISYRVCNGTLGNGANTFTPSGSVAGETNFLLACNQRATAGADRETVASIKFRAPKAYETQNRAVVAEDYRRIILRDNADIQSVSVWGGEENDPPIYGKVYAALKPFTGTLISSPRKEEITRGIRKYSLFPLEILDPTYLYIVPTISVTYDSRLTTRTATQIADLIAQRVIQFETTQFNQFGSTFRYSKFLQHLDSSEASIVGTTAVINLSKRFRPSTTTKGTYSFQYSTPLEFLGQTSALSLVRGGSNRHPGWGFVTSTPFIYQGYTSFLEDNGFGTLRIYYPDTTSGRLGRIYTNYSAGTVDYDTGQLILESFLPTSITGAEMKINVKPRVPDVTPAKNQLLLFADTTISVTEVSTKGVVARLNTVATNGQTATFNETAIASAVNVAS